MRYYISSPQFHHDLYTHTLLNQLKETNMISVTIEDGGFCPDLEMNVNDVTLSDGITTITCFGITWGDFTPQELISIFNNWKQCVKNKIEGFLLLS